MSIKSVPLVLTLVVVCGLATADAQEKFAPPSSPRREYNFDAAWKFFKEKESKAVGAEAVAFDDSKWKTVSTPHTFNDVDSFRTLISHGRGDRGAWQGPAWYRKHFKLPPGPRRCSWSWRGCVRAGEIFLNGKSVGLSENGVTAYGVDITDQVKYGGKENVLAVHVDNRGDYAEKATGVRFEWNVNDFNPNFGGINRHVWLHVTGQHPSDAAHVRRPEDHRRLHLSDELRRARTDCGRDRRIAGANASVATRPAFPFRSWSCDKGGQVRAKFERRRR